VAARFLLQAIGDRGPDYLVGLTLLFLANLHWFSYLVFRDRTATPERRRQSLGGKSSWIIPGKLGLLAVPIMMVLL
jgi:hypothetical protein